MGHLTQTVIVVSTFLLMTSCVGGGPHVVLDDVGGQPSGAPADGTGGDSDNTEGSPSGETESVIPPITQSFSILGNSSVSQSENFQLSGSLQLGAQKTLRGGKYRMVGAFRVIDSLR